MSLEEVNLFSGTLSLREHSPLYGQTSQTLLSSTSRYARSLLKEEILSLKYLKSLADVRLLHLREDLHVAGVRGERQQLFLRQQARDLRLHDVPRLQLPEQLVKVALAVDVHLQLRLEELDSSVDK